MLFLLLVLPLAGLGITLLGWRLMGEQTALWVNALFSVAAALLAIFGAVAAGDGSGALVLLSPWLESGTLSSELLLAPNAALPGAPILIFSLVTLGQLLILDWRPMAGKHQKGEGERARLSAMMSGFAASTLLFVVAEGLAQLVAGLSLSLVAAVLLAGASHRTRLSGILAQRLLVSAMIAVMGTMIAAALLFGAVDGSLLSIITGAGALSDPSSVSGMSVGALAGMFVALGAMAVMGQLFFHGWIFQSGRAPGPAFGILIVAVPWLGLVLLTLMAEHVDAPAPSALLVWGGALSAALLALFAIFQVYFRGVVALLAAAQAGVACALIGLGEAELARAHFLLQGICLLLLAWGAARVTSLANGALDLDQMGGRRAMLPVIYGALLIGAAGLSGFGLPFSYDSAVLGIGGFTAMGAALNALPTGPLFWLVLASYGFTSYAIWRAMILCFQGQARDTGPDKAAAAEPFLTRWLLWTLAITAILAPSVGPEILTRGTEGESLTHLPFLVFLGGLGAAAIICIWQRSWAEDTAERADILRKPFVSGGAIEGLTHLVIIAPGQWIGRTLGHRLDTSLLDALMTALARVTLPLLKAAWARLGRGRSGQVAMTGFVGIVLISTVIAMVGA